MSIKNSNTDDLVFVKSYFITLINFITRLMGFVQIINLRQEKIEKPKMLEINLASIGIST
jgi:hypothetical protein